MNETTTRRLLTLVEAGNRVGRSRATIIRLINKGKLTSHRPGPHYAHRVDEDELLTLYGLDAATDAAAP